jgi:hypothetical protein
LSGRPRSRRNGTVASFSNFASSATMTVEQVFIYFDVSKADAVYAGNDPTTTTSTLTFQLTP